MFARVCPSPFTIPWSWFFFTLISPHLEFSITAYSWLLAMRTAGAVEPLQLLIRWINSRYLFKFFPCFAGFPCMYGISAALLQFSSWGCHTAPTLFHRHWGFSRCPSFSSWKTSSLIQFVLLLSVKQLIDKLDGNFLRGEGFLCPRCTAATIASTTVSSQSQGQEPPTLLLP